jgi:predicted CXXCH cytochrome family protein
MGMRRWITTPGAALLLAATLVGPSPLPAAGTGEGGAPPSGIVFTMPAAGSFIPGGPVVVAGSVPAGAGWVNLLLDGEAIVAVNREGNTFSATLSPGSGSHEVEAVAGDLSARVGFAYGIGGRGAPPYRYHRPVLENRCAECHAGVRRGGPRAEADTCKSCHRKIAVVYPFVHGPVAVGKCLVCHDPHGSASPALLPSDARTLCTKCHDQPSTMAHVEKSRSQVCYLCHNPHASMNRRLLYDIVQ